MVNKVGGSPAGVPYCFPHKQYMRTKQGLHVSLRKHAHAINIFFLAFKIENFQRKNVGIFLIFFFQSIDCGYRGGSNEDP